MQPPDTAFAAEWAETLIHGRRTVLPKRLAAPGPDYAQLQRILRAAAAAPDHGERLPWRFVIVPQMRRSALAEVFAASLRERDAQATEEQVAQAREKAFRAPLLMLAVCDTGAAGDEIPPAERLVSAGCAIQNMLLMATVLGFGSALTSGKAMGSRGLRGLFGLGPQEQALCFVNIGTIAGKKRGRERPDAASYVSELGGPP
ncbi:MAG TPA: nitroreductase [Ramlibacter sp.]|uniref:nitroreductase family protein n=1 Tax=Ramlibacter sp. TaxID=1917967 RepID=UPI002ED3CF52